MSKKYRVKSTGQLVQAIRYSNPTRPWKSEDVAELAKFVLGHDMNTRITVSNEHILDVVRPVESRWAPHDHLADVTVADWVRSTTLNLSIGWWLIKDEQGALFATNNTTFESDYEPFFTPPPPKTDFDILADLIYNNFPWEGETYQAVAERVASQIINDGWVKRG